MVNSPNEEGDKIREAADLIQLCEFQDFVREFFFLFIFKSMPFSFSQFTGRTYLKTVTFTFADFAVIAFSSKNRDTLD